jgi:hypothetical protein
LLERALLHRPELEENRDLARTEQPLETIVPLESRTTTSIPSVVSVKQTGPYRLRLRFDDGAEGGGDIQATVAFESVFAPLRDPAYFSRVRVDEEARTIV